MTPGQRAYEEDCRRTGGVYPASIGGGQRPRWEDLDPFVQENWHRNPTPRRWESQGKD